MGEIVIYNALLVTPERVFRGFMSVTPPFINEVGEGDAPEGLLQNAVRCIDAGGAYLLPGAIDDQVHFREPGLTHKGDIHSESRAAAAGGVTSYMDMPNTKPPTLDMESIARKHEIAARESAVNYSFFIGGSEDNYEALRAADFSLIPGIKVFLGSSTGNMLVDDDAALDRIFGLGRLVAVHSEDDSVIRRNMSVLQSCFARQGYDAWLHPLVRSRGACRESTRRAVERAMRMGTRLHLLHISTADELEFFRPGRPSEKQITAEVCIPHLWFTDADYGGLGMLIKCNPAVKTPFDRTALRDAVSSGLIDVVGTDHAPHTLAEKAGDIRSAASGTPTVQFLMPMMLDLSLQGCFPLTTVADMLSSRPAELYHIDRRGELRPGFYADFVIARRVNPYQVTKDDILSRCRWSPLENTSLQHRIEATFVNGKMVYDGSGVIDNAGAAMPLVYSS